METTILALYIYIYPSSPFLGTLNIRCRIIMGIQKGAIILTTTHMGIELGIDFLEFQAWSWRAEFGAKALIAC